MPLSSNADFEGDPIQWAANVQRDIETLFELSGKGTNDGNASSVPMTQQNTQVDIENQTFFNTAINNNPISITFNAGNTVNINQDGFAGLTGLQIQLRLVTICVSGVQMRMLVLGSQPFP